MTNEEAKQIVSAGLEQRKADRETAAQESLLEQYEQEQIRACNENCAGARMKRDAERATRLTIQKAEAKRAERAADLAKAQAREDAAMSALRNYGLACLAALWLTAFTHLPIWAAAALALGLGVFPAAYIFRLYYPAGQEA